MLLKVTMPDYHLKIDRNPNITVATGKGPWVSCLTSRRVPISLPSFYEIIELSLIPRKEP